MFVLGIQGSPQKNGSTAYLLDLFMQEAKLYGAQTKIINMKDAKIAPCNGCNYCKKHGVCVIDNDDMSLEFFSLLRKADVIVAASPVYFYNVPAQMKALIDRVQTFWSRKYIFKLSDPAKKYKQGIMLSQGATSGKNLFQGIALTMQYFFDAVDASFNEQLVYRQVDKKEKLIEHKTINNDIKEIANGVLEPLSKRKKILFACRENACRSQIAAAFAMHLAGNNIEAFCAGSEPTQNINPQMIKAMSEEGIDMAFRTPQSIDTALSYTNPEIIITMGCGETCPHVPNAKVIDWDIPDPAGKPYSFMCKVRDEIKSRVLKLQ